MTFVNKDFEKILKNNFFYIPLFLKKNQLNKFEKSKEIVQK